MILGGLLRDARHWSLDTSSSVLETFPMSRWCTNQLLFEQYMERMRNLSNVKYYTGLRSKHYSSPVHLTGAFYG